MEIIKYQKRVKARKQHICDYCGKTIKVGEIYTRATYKQDEIYDWKTCDRCKPYVDEAFSSNYDFSDGMTDEDFKNYMFEEHRDIAEEWWRG